ncbi:MAG: T9SS type A sorting domain-containing protein, partial [Bacteroidota bacterium]
TVEITFDYELANSSSCPNCIRQIVFGYENEAIDCAYDGIPVVCSDSTTAGNFTGTFTAPTEAGTYEIFWGDDFNFSCADAKENYGNLEKTPIATITVNCSATSSVSNVSLNGMGTDVSVADTGTVIEIAFDYALSNPSTCPTCIRQIVFGYENEAIDCAYDDIPVVCSDSTTAGSFTGTFVAPTEAGTYEIFWGDDFNFSCNDAKENYANLEKTPIATITVNCSGSSSVSNVSLDGMGTDLSVVDTGATVEISFDYELANPESCPTCIRQIVFGYENEAIDCAYDDIPVVCSDSATMGTFTGTFIAPTETGTYEIFWADDFNFTCADAKENYGNLGKTAIATLTVTMVSSQENIEALSTIAKVYPNPATDLLTVEIQNGSLQDMKLSIINLMGQQVLSEVYTRDLSARKELNIDHLPKGTYYLQIQTADKMYTGKISIQ